MDNLILFFISTVAATLTFIVSIKLKQGAVIASAALSLIVALFFRAFPNLIENESLINSIPAYFMGATFVGMSAKEVIKNEYLVAIAGGIFAIIFMNANTLIFDGYGGGLGTSACLAVLITTGILYLLEYSNIEVKVQKLGS